ncbi:MAG: hypothetical protein JNK04_01240 [Myxococcales bacterium]|nr:hypothetical protein [Myxococcales bacterium]
MSEDADLVLRCCDGTRDEVLESLRTLRQKYLQSGPPAPGLVDVLLGCAEGMVPGRGDPVLALSMFYFDVLMFVPPGLRTSAQGPGAPFVAAIEALVPRLTVLRDDRDVLVSIWAWHLLSWMPKRVPGLADEALQRLVAPARACERITLALAAASTPEGRAATVGVLLDWLRREGDERDVAAMVLTQLVGNPQKPEVTSEEAFAALLALSQRERWGEWEAAPAREHGFYADLAACLVRAGYMRADRSLPALVHLVDACEGNELGHVLDLVLKIFYQSHPYPGDAQRDALSEAQKATLLALLEREKVWAPRPRFYEGLKELGLPLGPVPLAAFLGVPAPKSPVEVRSVEDGVLTLKTDLSPHALVQTITQKGG